MFSLNSNLGLSRLLLLLTWIVLPVLLHFIKHRECRVNPSVLEVEEAVLVSGLAVLNEPFPLVLHLVKKCQVPVGRSVPSKE